MLLKRGATGAPVAVLQTLLTGVDDAAGGWQRGVFDTMTEDAVARFQASRPELANVVPGTVDDATWQAIVEGQSGSMSRVITGGVARRIIAIALSEAVRFSGQDSAGRRSDVVEYASITHVGNTSQVRRFYCDAFVNWVYLAAGVPLSAMAGFGGDDDTSADALMRWGKQTDQWLPKTKGCPPPPGSIVCYHFKKEHAGANHVGIVIGSDDERIFTVEGNTSPGEIGSQRAGAGVWEKMRRLDDVLGYVIPSCLFLDAVDACTCG